MTATATMDKRAILANEAWKVLDGLGMKDQDRLELYTTVKLPADATSESITEWAKLMKADNPDKFTAPATPVGQASLPGGPAVNAGSVNWKDVQAQTKSEDPKERKQARDLLTAYYQENGRFPD